MAIELAPHNIQVNAIAPGWIETEMTAPVRTPGMIAMNDEILARTPAGRCHEIAGTDGLSVLARIRFRDGRDHSRRRGLLDQVNAAPLGILATVTPQ